MKIIITGKKGMLGSALVRSCMAQGIPYVAYDHKEMDITNPEDVRRVAAEHNSMNTVVINAAGAVRNKVGYLRYDFAPRDAAEQDGLMAYTNTVGPHILSANFSKVVQISTDCVFDGTEGPYDEQACPHPADLYGASKLGGELGRPDLTIRGSFVGFGKGSFLDRMIFSVDKGTVVNGFHAWRWNGLYVDTFAAFVLQCARMNMTGLIHAVGPHVSKYRLLTMVADTFRPDVEVRAVHSDEKDMRLESALIPQIYTIFGLDYAATWPDMLERMKYDNENPDPYNSDDPGGAEPGE